MTRLFPGFESLYQLQDPLLDEPYRGHFDLPFDIIQLVMIGEYIPVEPVTVHQAMGGEPWEVIWGDQIGALAVAQRVVNVLRAGNFSGWSAYHVVIYDDQGKEIQGYSGIAVTGRCGPIDYKRSRLVEVDTLIPDYVGLYFDPESWDGADLFFADRGRPFVVSEVRNALETADVSNLVFTPLQKVRTPQIAVDGLTDDIK